jgi:hypothetical protein
VQNLTTALKSDRINFQTTLDLKSIGEFYRDAFAKQGLFERKFLANFSDEFFTLVFENPLNDTIVVLSVVDLAYSSSQDLRNVNIQTENSPYERSADSSK